jgi:hypothetical protein
MENAMRCVVLKDRHKIIGVINHLILARTELKVRIKGRETVFTSRFIKIDPGDNSPGIDGRPEPIIEKVVPDEGNALIQSVREVDIEFSIKKNSFRCPLRYIGISTTQPYFGFIVGLPESIEIEEKRKEERIICERPGLLSVRFKLGEGDKKGKVYDLNVRDRSRHGLGLLVTEKDFDLLEMLDEGDRLDDMTVFDESALIKASGIVRHKTEIQEGRYKGCYIIGIESPDLIES